MAKPKQPECVRPRARPVGPLQRHLKPLEVPRRRQYIASLCMSLGQQSRCFGLRAASAFAALTLVAKLERKGKALSDIYVHMSHVGVVRRLTELGQC